MTLQSQIAAASPGATLDLTGQSFNESFNIDKSLTLLNGTVTAPAAGQFGTGACQISHDNVVIDGMNIDGGYNVFGMFAGYVNVTIRNTLVNRNLHTGPVAWFTTASSFVTIEGNHWETGDFAIGFVSIFSYRAWEPQNGAPFIFAHDVTIRNNYFNQGPSYQTEAGTDTHGWFGCEFKGLYNVLFDGNEHHGGQVLISMPDCYNYEIRHEDFYFADFLRIDGGYHPWLGVEIAGPTGNPTGVPGTSGVWIHHCYGHSAHDGSGWLCQGNSLTAHMYPMITVECNTMEEGTLCGGLLNALVQNNTLLLGAIDASAGTPNTNTTMINNDADGAQAPACAESGGGPFDLQATLIASALLAADLSGRPKGYAGQIEILAGAT